MFEKIFRKSETEKAATRNWNGMDPLERNRALFRLLSKGKIQVYEITEFREKHDFDDLPRHIRSALVEHWKDGPL